MSRWDLGGAEGANVSTRASETPPKPAEVSELVESRAGHACQSPCSAHGSCACLHRHFHNAAGAWFPMYITAFACAQRLRPCGRGIVVMAVVSYNSQASRGGGGGAHLCCSLTMVPPICKQGILGTRGAASMTAWHTCGQVQGRGGRGGQFPVVCELSERLTGMIQ